MYRDFGLRANQFKKKGPRIPRMSANFFVGLCLWLRGRRHSQSNLWSIRMASESGFEFWVLGFGFWVLGFGFWVGGCVCGYEVGDTRRAGVRTMSLS